MNSGCDMIKDLLPSYADKKCSEYTTEFVEKHLCQCDECRKISENMGIRLQLNLPDVTDNRVKIRKKISFHFTSKAIIIASLISLLPLISFIILVFTVGGDSILYIMLFQTLTVIITMTASYNKRFLFIPVMLLFIISAGTALLFTSGDIFLVIMWAVIPPVVGAVGGKIVKLIVR